jgi:hypothetical protein
MLRQDLDTVEQALKIEQAGQDTELEALIAKWKTVSREAAEELFAGARDRVNRMGGVRAWKERIRNSQKARNAWDSDGQGAGFSGTVGERIRSDLGEEMKSRKEELEDEIAHEHRGTTHDSQDEEKTDVDGGEDEVCFLCLPRFLNQERSSDEPLRWSGPIANLVIIFTDIHHGHDAQEPEY